MVGKVQIIRQQDPCDNSVRDEKHMRLKPLNLNNNALEAENYVEVAFATISTISIVKFIKSAKLEFFRVTLLNLLRCEAIAFARVL